MSINANPIIFLAFANDREDRARYLRNLAEEARLLHAALDTAAQAGLCEVLLRQNVTLETLLDVFQDARYRNRIAVFHYGGHAESYELLLETAAGKTAVADAGGLAAFLGQQTGIQLVFLNGCSSQPQAQGLLEAGVAAVIATAQAIDDAVATDFSVRFYKGLAGGATLQTAFHEAEAACKTARGGQPRGLYLTEALSASGQSLLADRWPWALTPRPGAELALQWNLPQAARNPLFGLPPLPPLDLPAEPYRYLDWYHREDGEIFLGRGREIRELYDRVTAAASSPIVLFYGQSGVGKSSLLAAGLLPRLEAGLEVYYARRDQAAGLLGTLVAALGGARDADLATLWRDLEARAGRPLLVILDQVEEVFTRPNPEQPDELVEFLAGLTALFAQVKERPRGRLLLSFRKEWLAEINTHLSEYRLPRSEVFLGRLGREGVLEVVAGTARLHAHYGLSVDAALPALIADDLLADRESPVAPMLAILLADLWQAAKARSYEHPTFDVDLYHDLRSRGLSLDAFLGRQLQLLHEQLSEAVESGLALDMLAYHTTPLGTAGERTQVKLEEVYQHRQDVLPGLLQACRDTYLLVDAAQNQPGQSRRSRLTHDTLAPHIRKWFDESVAPGQQARRILESRAAQWKDAAVGPVLDEADLRVVEAGQAGMRAVQTIPESLRLLQASRAARQRQRLQRRLAISTIVLLALAVLLAVNQNKLREMVLKAQARQDAPQIALEGLKYDRYEVSVALYAMCHRANSNTCPEPQDADFRDYLKGEEGLGAFPVVGITAVQAQSFCTWLGRRLPTVEEWQMAVREWEAGALLADDSFARDNSYNMRKSDAAWRVTDSRGQSPDKPLHLIGNVWEWTRTNTDGEIWSGETGWIELQRVSGGFSTPMNDLTDFWAADPEGHTPETGFRCIQDNNH